MNPNTSLSPLSLAPIPGSYISRHGSESRAAVTVTVRMSFKSGPGPVQGTVAEAEARPANLVNIAAAVKGY